jgi:TonB family protein
VSIKSRLDRSLGCRHVLRKIAFVLLLIAGFGSDRALSDDNSTCSDQKVEADARIEACTKLLELNDQNSPGKSRVLASRGRAYFQKNDFDRALSDYNDAVKSDPDNADAFLYRAGAHWKKFEDGKAFGDLSEAIRLDPTPERLEARAWRYIAVSQPDLAIADLTRAVASNPRSSEAYLDRGRAHGMKSEFELAIADFDQALSIDPDNKRAALLRDTMREAKGENLSSLKDYGRMLVARLQAQKIYPRAAFREKSAGTTRISFTIGRGGKLLESGVKEGSGSDVLDREALDTLRRSQPLPPLPFGARDSERYEVPIVFRLP